MAWDALMPWSPSLGGLLSSVSGVRRQSEIDEPQKALGLPNLYFETFLHLIEKVPVMR
jgi:hypothetical protein